MGEGEAVTLSEHARLRREASALKLRAMRLRTLGDEADRAQAIVLLRRAASAELRALESPAAPSHEAQVGAIVEACGLFLEAQDAVRAADAWSRLPRWAFSSPEGSAMLSEIRPRIEASVVAFVREWRSLAKTGLSPNPHQLNQSKLRSLLNEHQGVAELWWALSVGAHDPGALAARARAVELLPALAEESTAQRAWDQIGDILVRNLKIELKNEQPQAPLTLDLVGRIVTAMGALVRRFVATTVGDLAEPLQLVPRAAHSGSFIFDVSAHGLPLYAFEDLDEALREMAPEVDVRALRELLALLQQHRVRLAVFVAPRVDAELSRESPALLIDARRRSSLTPRAEAVRARIDSANIPQADNLERVFSLIELVAKHEAPTPENLGEIRPRQVSYYRRAAKILGLLTESDELTPAGRLLARLGAEDRLRATVVHFESSEFGEAWIRWSGGRTMLDVDPRTAADFLKECVPGLSTDTAERRAKTLIAWHRLLSAHHYARGAAPST